MDPRAEAYYIGEHRKSADPGYLARLLAPLEVHPGSSVLDVGSGTGYVNAYLAATFALELNLGFDLDADAIRLAPPLNGGAGAAEWFCASAEAIPLPDASVDHVICRVVLPLCDVARSVGEMARVLRPQGNMVLLLHRWTMYRDWISLRPARWKRTAAGILDLGLGLLFNTTGHQWQPRRRGHRVGQTFQTVARMRSILRRYQMEVFQVARTPELVIYARRVGAGRSLP